jgi:peptide/nickel transport system substrate-binding protein
MKRLNSIFALLIVAALILAACGGAATTAAPQPTQAPANTQAPAPTEAPALSEITVVIANDPATLDPQVSEDFNEKTVNDNVYETLLDRDQDLAIIPGLATAYEQVDDTTWKFTLRQGVSFHNGEPFNADAAVFSILRMIDPNTKSDQASNFATITGAEKVDDNTIHIITSGPDPLLPARISQLKIVEPKHAADAEAFAITPIGTGPYKFVKWDRGVEVVIEANADYWGGKPAIDIVHLRPIQEESTRLAALQAGEVDLVFGLLPEQIDQAPVAVHTPGLEFPMILLSNRPDSPIADVRLREAINYAIDKEALAEALYGGFAVPADGQILTPGHFGYNPAVTAFEYDPDKAKALMAEAGYNGEEILLESEVGRWLKDKELVEAVVGQLAEVGFNVKINISEFSKYLEILFDKENRAPMIFVSHDNSLLDADRTLTAYFTCDGTGPSYCNEEVSAMIVAARTETDVAKREQMYHQIVETAHNEASHLYLLNVENIYGLSERLNWAPRRDGKLLYATMSIK